MIGYSSTSKILLLFCLLIFAHTYDIDAIETGSVQFPDKLIRLNTCMARKVELKLTKEYYDSHKDIQVVVSISGLKMDDQLTFYIYHNLACNKKFCQLEINVQRYTPEVNQFSEYGLTIDYLVAHGLKIVDFNMTYHTQHFQIPAFEPEMDVSEWTAVLIPYGFSDLKLLAKVQYQLVPNSNFLRLTYKEGQNLGNEVVQPTWTLGKKFILYKIVFLPKTYLQNKLNSEEFTSFFGFSSAQNNQINVYKYINNLPQLEQSQSQLDQASYFSIPIRKTAIFNDNRKIFIKAINEPTTTVLVEQSGNNFERFLYGAVLIVLVQIAYLLYKKKMIEKSKLLNQTVIFPDLIISFDESRTIANQTQLKDTESNIQTVNDMKRSFELKQ